MAQPQLVFAPAGRRESSGTARREIKRIGSYECMECGHVMKDGWFRCGKCGTKRASLQRGLQRELSSETVATAASDVTSMSRVQAPFLAPARRRSAAGTRVIRAFDVDQSHFDLLVIGGGPAGVAAALEGAMRGLRVGLIEQKQLITGAPTGTHSKCLREAVLAGATSWEEVAHGLGCTVNRAVGLTSRQLQAFNVVIKQGSANLIDKTSLEFTLAPDDADDDSLCDSCEGGATAVSPEVLSFETLVIATGSKAYQRPPTDFSLPGVYDTDTIWELDRTPKMIVAQGAGIISLEYAVILKSLGTESCILVDPAPNLLPMLDVALREASKETLKKCGIEVVMNTMFHAVEALPGSTHDDPKLRITLAGGRVLDCDCLLSATGRYGASAGMGLEKLESEGLRIGRGSFIQTDEWGHTGCGNIYAVGDVAGGALATIAQAQGVRAVRHAAGSEKVRAEQGGKVKPSAVWTIPEMAWAGLNEAECQENVVDYDTVTVDFSQTLRACVARSEEGFLKLIYERNTRRLLGVHMFGERSADHINFGAELIDARKTTDDILQFVFPAVTYHELYRVAATEAKLRTRFAFHTNHLLACVTWSQVKRTAIRRARDADLSVEEVLRNEFMMLDTDRSGLLTLDELEVAFKHMGMDLPAEAVKEMFVEAVGDPEITTLDYRNFLKVFDVLKEFDARLSEESLCQSAQCV